MVKKIELLSQRDMAKQLGISQTCFNRYVQDGRLPAPTYEVGRRKHYLSTEVKRMKQRYKKLKSFNRHNWLHDLPAQGLYTQTKAADELKMPRITFQSYIDRQLIPKPSHRVPGKLIKVYNNKDIEDMKLILLALGYYDRKGRGRKKA